jgi:hypothetical protein
MKKRKLKARIRSLKRENRALLEQLAKYDPYYRVFTQPFKVGDVVHVKLPPSLLTKPWSSQRVFEP